MALLQQKRHSRGHDWQNDIRNGRSCSKSAVEDWSDDTPRVEVKTICPNGNVYFTTWDRETAEKYDEWIIEAEPTRMIHDWASRIFQFIKKICLEH
jgi:hypothetical protein